MKRRTIRIISFLIFLGILTLWIVLFKYVNPQVLIGKIGVTNGYIILFLIGAIGGASIFTGPSYFIALATLSIVGLNPILLGIFGGLGVTIGDSITFFIGLSVAKKAPEKIKEKISKIEKILEKRSKKMVNFMIYTYIGFLPLPNEFVTIPLGLIGYKKRIIILFLLLGNITSGILGALLALYGIQFVSPSPSI